MQLGQLLSSKLVIAQKMLVILLVPVASAGFGILSLIHLGAQRSNLYPSQALGLILVLTALAT